MLRMFLLRSMSYEMVPARCIAFHLPALKQWTRWISRHQTYHDGINKGNTWVKRPCKFELYFVRYGQLSEHLDHFSMRGNKKWNFQDARRKSGYILPFGDHTAFIAWLETLRRGTHEAEVLIGIRWGSEKKKQSAKKAYFKPVFCSFWANFSKIAHFPSHRMEIVHGHKSFMRHGFWELRTKN